MQSPVRHGQSGLMCDALPRCSEYKYSTAKLKENRTIVNRTLCPRQLFILFYSFVHLDEQSFFPNQGMAPLCLPLSLRLITTRIEGYQCHHQAGNYLLTVWERTCVSTDCTHTSCRAGMSQCVCVWFLWFESLAAAARGRLHSSDWSASECLRCGPHSVH